MDDITHKKHESHKYMILVVGDMACNVMSL
jgi:hypothetical protein